MMLLLRRPLLLLCSFLAFCAAGPVRINQQHESQPRDQQLFNDQAHYTAVHFPNSNTHLDAAPNSVGVLFTTADDEDVTHIWLPLGKRLYTRDAPELPLHPLTARITTMIRSSPQTAAPEYLDRVICDIHPRYNRTADNQNSEAMFISVTKSDGLVRLADADVKRWREVESYECS